jgi:hypothetical protein
VSENAAPPGAPLFVAPWGIASQGVTLIVVLGPGTFGVPGGGQDPPGGGGGRPPNRDLRAGPSGRVPLGTTFGYTISDPAQVRFTVHRRLAGRVDRGRCRRPTTASRVGKRCARHVVVGSFTQRGRRARPLLYRAERHGLDRATPQAVNHLQEDGSACF